MNSTSTRKKLFLLTLLCSLTLGLFAQDFEVPEFNPQDSSEYKLYEKDILKCITWLENTPLQQEKEKRQKANEFLMSWLTGTPDVYVIYSSKVTAFQEISPDLLPIFLGGWVRYAIENGYSKDIVKGHIAGLKSVFKAFELNKELKKDAYVKKLIALDEKGELEKWVQEQTAQSK